MKKLISVIAVLVLSMAIFTGCSEVTDNTSSETSATTTSGESSESIDTVKSNDDSFEAFVTYMSDNGYIKGDGQDLTASAIGAAQGKRYTITANGSRIYVELYEFKNTSSELASKTINNAKNNGKFELFDSIDTQNTVAAVSKNEKFLMLYTDSSTNGSNIETKNNAVEAVKSYGK